MPIRRFDGVDDRITLAIGSLGFAFGSVNGATIAVIGRRLASSTSTIFQAGVSGGVRYGLEASLGAVPLLRTDGATAAAPTITLSLNSELELLAVSKATGSVAPRFHKYDFGSAVWQHENSATSIANSGSPITSAFFGANHLPASFWNGDLSMAAVWNVVLSDAEVESLVASYEEWLTPTPLARWRLDQANVGTALQDDVGAADQSAITGTSVVTEDTPFAGGSGGSGGDKHVGPGNGVRQPLTDGILAA